MKKIINNNTNQNIYFPYMLISIPFMYLSFMLPIYSKGLGMSSVQTAGLYSAFSFIVLIFRPVLGKLCDKTGRKLLLIYSIFIYCISFYFYSFAYSAEILYISRILQAFASPMLSISIYCFVADYSGKSVGERLGKLETSYSRGGIAGIVIAVVIFEAVSSKSIPKIVLQAIGLLKIDANLSDFLVGWKLFLYTCCIINILAVLYIILKVKETKSENSILQKEETKLSKTIIKLLIIDFFLSCFSSMLYPMFVLYLQDKFSADIYEIGIAYMLPLIVSCILPKYIGRLNDRREGKTNSRYKRRIKGMIIALMLGAISFVIFPSINSTFMSAVIYCVITMTSSLYDTASDAVFSSETHIENRGTLVGIYSTISGLGAVIGPIVGGVVYKNISISAPFYLCAGGYFLTAILTIMLFKNYYLFEKRFS